MNVTTRTAIDVLFCADGPYFQHLGATIVSLLRANPHHQFRLFVCSAKRDVSGERNIDIVVSQFGNATTHYLHFDIARLHPDLRQDGYLTIETYLRLFVTEFMDPQVSRLLYMDCDVIVCDDIGELWEAELGDHMMAAVPEPYLAAHPGFEEGEQYFSAGVLVFDVQRWRAANVVSQFVAFGQQNASRLTCHDQDILNNVFKGRVAPLSYRWNFQTSFADLSAASLNMSKEAFRALRRHPGIVHYTGQFKPWWYKYQPHYKALYWDALMFTPWRAYRPPDQTPRMMLQKALRGTWLRERLNWCAPRLLDSIRAAVFKGSRLRVDPTARW